MLEEEGLAKVVCEHLRLDNIEANNKEWEQMIEKIHNAMQKEIDVAIVGKYVRLEDSYLSVAESLRHAGFENGVKVNIKYIDSEEVTSKNVKELLSGMKAVVVPGGFGSRGIEGMIETIKYVRENEIPFLGICLGMQMAVIEFARNVLKLEGVNSEEFDPMCKNPVIHIMYDQKDIKRKGGTMRLGSYPCVIKSNSLAEKIYNQKEINERHRHRFEYNNGYKTQMEEAGLIASGTSPDGSLVEIVELKNHPFFVASQFHPEFKSRPDKPAPLFVNLIKAAI